MKERDGRWKEMGKKERTPMCEEKKQKERKISDEGSKTHKRSNRTLFNQTASLNAYFRGNLGNTQLHKYDI